jgi:hypothetical protein
MSGLMRGTLFLTPHLENPIEKKERTNDDYIRKHT